MEEKLNIGDLVERYVELRDHLSIERKNFKELEANLKEDLEIIEMKILKFQDEIGSNSISTDAGTAMRVTKEFYRVGCWDTVLKYILDSGNTQMLERRIAKIATKEVLSENPDLNATDIGVDYSKEFAIQVRRK